MSVITSYPGVYVQEVPSGVRTIVGVSTSIAMFIGRTRQGRLNKPRRCTCYADFMREFSEDASLSDLPRYVRLFFLNGGTDCYVMRIANGATAAEVTLWSEAGTAQPNTGGAQPVLRLVAKQHGAIGEAIRAAVTYAGPHPEATFNLELFRWERGGGRSAARR